VLARNRAVPGARALAAVLAGCREPPLTRSELERRFVRLCEGHGLPPPAANALVAGQEVDFVWAKAGLVVETDGRGSHGTRAAFERDPARDAELTALGWRVVRFT
jgi:Protein of unknown function (DUF559)